MTDALETLRRELGDAVSSDPAALAAHARDAWMLAELDDFEGAPRTLPLAVLQPESTETVARALALCARLGVAVVPVGGASGVCGAIAPGATAVALSTRRLAGLRRVETEDLLAVFGAGTMGVEAEQALTSHGLTLGHWPQSIDISTVGGWVATRASGQYSTAYGSIEDLVLALEVVLADGSILRTRETPRAAAGPDLRQLFLGSEGTLGVVTEVTFSVRPRAETTRGQAFHFADFRTGLDSIRRALRSGWRPPVARLYDARESRRNFRDFVPKDRALLLLLHEGPEAVRRRRDRRTRTDLPRVRRRRDRRRRGRPMARSSQPGAELPLVPGAGRRRRHDRSRRHLESRRRALRERRRSALRGARACCRRRRTRATAIAPAPASTSASRRGPSRRAGCAIPMRRAGVQRWTRPSRRAAASRITTASAACVAPGSAPRSARRASPYCVR